MKTAKKIFSLLLVAVLMLSAIPFQASATEEDAAHVIRFRFTAGSDTVKSVTATKGENGEWSVAGSQAPSAPSGYTLDGWYLWNTGDKFTTPATFTVAEDDFRNNGSGTMYADFYGAVTAIHVCTEFDEENPVEEHEADCLNAGYKILKCADEDCEETKRVTTQGALGHDMGAWIVVDEAEVGEAGLKRRDCSRCDYYETEEIDALPEPPAPTYPVEFYDLDGNLVATRNWEMHKVIANDDLPLAPELLNKDFTGWFTSPTSNIELKAGDRFDNYYNKFYAQYDDSTHDGQSKVNVYFRLYSEGVAQGQARKLTSFQVADYTNLEDALDARMDSFSDMLEAVVDMGMYKVADGYYVYNPSTGAQSSLTSSAKVNGDTSIIIRLDANRSARATVMVFVHKKVDAAAAYTYTMSGYTVNDTVFESDVEALLKSKGTNYTVNGMYSDFMWERKNDGYTTNPVDTLSIEDDGENGVLKIHVLAEKFSAGSTTSKPASNPTTGDYAMIEATAAIMLLSAAAVVVLTQLRKRKMI